MLNDTEKMELDLRNLKYGTLGLTLPEIKSQIQKKIRKVPHYPDVQAGVMTLILAGFLEVITCQIGETVYHTFRRRK